MTAVALTAATDALFVLLAGSSRWSLRRCSGARTCTTTETSFIPLQDQVDYEDYRNVDGVMLPFLIRSSDGSPFDTSVKAFTTLRHDVDVDN